MWARVDGNSLVVEVISENPEGKYHPSLIWEEVNDDIKPGMVKSSDSYVVQEVEQSQNLNREEIEYLRLRAYADPVNGSDRYFSEALSLQSEGLSPESDEVKAVKEKGLERKKAIQEIYPWPNE